ncbi:E3 ubiquitin-protein ligase HERC4 [Phytophthora nicotianae]|uniref:E3 ubiquitin-protein ligase HERC4 n=1 Tax=Phytophthora nicotianae TaxID=4792 RepID=A0A0W8CI08_PHYNI|nr:E3 ubiquitin-protein ligase HERC4 [Phytophthora nicotianae]KUF89354.1 E3 ubiquitin-protein ligase HERC4 [Phytophthora nicotianae]
MECRCVSISANGNGLFSECVSPTDLKFVAVDGGDTFTIGVLADSGEVVGWGKAFYGERPDEHKNVPVKLNVPERCKTVGCGSNHVLALTDSSRVIAWGWNRSGQVGAAAIEDVVRVPTFVKFPIEDVEIVEVAAGGMHSLAVDSRGRVWAWGCNTYGQLGIDFEVKQQHTPMLVALPADVRVQHVAAGWAHSALISTSGEVFTFGWGLYNQLGHGSTQNEHEPVLVDALRGLDSDIVQVACGNWHTAALTASGDLYTWGWGKDSQLGPEASVATQVLPRVVNVSARSETTEDTQDVTDVACGNRFTLVLCQDGSIQCWGPKSPHPGWLPRSTRLVLKLAAGNSHAILLEKKNQDTKAK